MMADDLVGARLTLAKAKIFGIHTGMYEIQNLSALRGKSLHFLWQRDQDGGGAVVGFIKDLGGAITSAANAVANAVEIAIETVAEAVSEFIELIGNAVADWTYAVGNSLGGFPGDVVHWFGSVASAVFHHISVAIKGTLDGFANVLAGLIRVVGGAVGGLLAWDTRVLVRGFGDIAAGVVGSLFAVGATTIGSIQAGFAQQMGERRLADSEQNMLRLVYRNSVNLLLVRVIDGNSGVFNLSSRPFTIGNTIYMRDYLRDKSPRTYSATLVHECCHVWQYQHIGTRYIADALWAQATLPGMGYSWAQEVALGRFRWQDFNKEAQAKFLEDVFSFGTQIPTTGVLGEFCGDDPIGRNVDFMGTDNTGLARDSVAYVRSAGGIGISIP
ncbi:MAG: hypothetical protein JJE16_04125 [Nitrospiraceae bacterium]|nr:hypothetical protein [Nitrospiraceae bacterium]